MVFNQAHTREVITLDNSLYSEHHRKGGWKWRIKRDSNTLLDKMCWKFGRGPVVTVDLPRVKDYVDELIAEEDVYFHYLPWLEEVVGKYRYDWFWKIEPFVWMEQHADDPNHILYSHKTILKIKIRKKKEHLASFMALKWGDQR